MLFLIVLLLTNALFVSALPANFDYRQKWQSCSAPVVNQDKCGACWAIAVTSAYTARACIWGNTQEKTAFVRWTGNQLSPQNLISCATGKGCNGGWPQLAWQYLSRTGAPTCGQLCQKGCMPYQSSKCVEGEDNQQNGCMSCSTTNYCRDGSMFTTWKSATGYQIMASGGSFEYPIMQEIYDHGPVVATYTLYENFYSFFSSNPHGIYTHTGGKRMGGHAVVIVGWGEENGIRYWLAQNSWGTNWGSQGFFKILRGNNLVNFEDNVTTGCPNNAACFSHHPSLAAKRDIEEGSEDKQAGGWELSDSSNEFVGYVPKVMNDVTKKRELSTATFVSIDEVKLQPVAGVNIDMKFRINVDGEEKSMRAMLHKPLEGEIEVINMYEL